MLSARRRYGLNDKILIAFEVWNAHVFSEIGSSKRYTMKALLDRSPPAAAQHDSCSYPSCYSAKVDAHVKRTVAAKPKLVQITTAYGKPPEGSAVVPRNQYVEIRQEKAQGQIPAGRAGVQNVRADAALKERQEKQRREEAQAQATGLRVLKAIGNAVPVPLMKRDLLFVVWRLSAMLDERKLAVLIRQHGMGKPMPRKSIGATFSAHPTASAAHSGRRSNSSLPKRTDTISSFS